MLDGFSEDTLETVTTFGKEHSVKQVEKDIHRTFRSMGLYVEGSPLGEQLKDILQAFTMSRPDIGYV
jgi:hypothetical protein